MLIAWFGYSLYCYKDIYILSLYSFGVCAMTWNVYAYFSGKYMVGIGVYASGKRSESPSGERLLLFILSIVMYLVALYAYC